VDNPAEDIAPEVVRAKEIGSVRSLEFIHRAHRSRVERGDLIREKGEHQQYQDHDESCKRYFSLVESR
jgi:hypothetical protein